jgi:uncharacterized OB-fold protein
MTAPAPTTDGDSQPYWDALAQHRIVLQECDVCHRRRFPRLASCPYCATPGGTDVEIAGTGVIYSFVRAHRAMTPAFVGETPYSVATVELDGGGRIVGRVEPPEDAVITRRVEPFFVDHDGWTELRFRPAS